MDANQRFAQMMVVQEQRDGFISLNTSTLPEWEEAGAGFERLGTGTIFNSDPWMLVYPIRYSGTVDGPNRWSL